MGKKKKQRGSGGGGRRAAPVTETDQPAKEPSGVPPPAARKGGARKKGSKRGRQTAGQGRTRTASTFNESHEAFVADGNVQISIKRSLEGSMSGDYEIGGGKSGVLEFWRGLDDNEKRETVTLEEAEVHRTLKSRMGLKQCSFTGEVDEEVVMEMVKMFMHAMEVQEGVVFISGDSTFESIAILMALEQQLLRRMGRQSVVRRAWMVALFLAWLSPRWWQRALGIGAIAVAGLGRMSPAQALRALAQKWVENFFEHEDLASKAEWKSDCYMSALMLMRMVKTMEHYFIVVVLIALPFLVSWIEAYSASEHDQRILGLVRGAVGWFNKIVLLWFARFSYMALILALIIFFPGTGLSIFGVLVLVTAFIADFIGRVLWLLCPQKLKHFLLAIWSSTLYKTLILGSITATGVMIVYYTWDYPPLWSYPIHGAVTFYLIYLLPMDFAPTAITTLLALCLQILNIFLSVVISFFMFIFRLLGGSATSINQSRQPPDQSD